MANTLQKIKIVILVLSLLLGLTLAILAGVIIYGLSESPRASAVVTDNYIEPDGGTKTKTAAKASMLCASFSPINSLSAFSKTRNTIISIYKNHAEDSEPFFCENMFPGDSEERGYLIQVSYSGRITVRFRADIRTGYEKLAEVLKCRVVLREENKAFYDGLMKDIPESINHQISSNRRKTEELTYDITVYLDTSVGNEYMNKHLVADFRWWVEECGNVPVVPDDPWEDTSKPADTTSPDTAEPDITTDDTSIPEESTSAEDTTIPNDTEKPDDGQLEAPQTGDDFRFYTLLFIAVLSLLIVILLMKGVGRRE